MNWYGKITASSTKMKKQISLMKLKSFRSMVSIFLNIFSWASQSKFFCNNRTVNLHSNLGARLVFIGMSINIFNNHKFITVAFITLKTKNKKKIIIMSWYYIYVSICDSKVVDTLESLAVFRELTNESIVFFFFSSFLLFLAFTHKKELIFI